MYEYKFSNRVRMHQIIMSHTNLVPRASFSTGQQQEGLTGTYMVCNSKVALVLNGCGHTTELNHDLAT